MCAGGGTPVCAQNKPAVRAVQRGRADAPAMRDNSMTTAYRNRLSVSALAAASSFIALSAPVQAQSVCSSVGTLVTCTNGTATTTIDADAVINAAAQGLSITDPTSLSAAIGGTINTTSTLPGLQVQSVGDLTLTASSGGALSIVGTGGGVGADLSSTTGATTATFGNVTVAGPFAVRAAGQTGTT